MPLNLYRRHSRKPGKCLRGHAPDSRNYEAEEFRRRWRKCACPIYADGTLDGRFKRHNTGGLTWAEAKIVAAEWESIGAWQDAGNGAAPLIEPSPVVEETARARPAATIQFAFEADRCSAPSL